MERRSNFDNLTIKTNNVSLVWKNVHGLAPENAAQKLDAAMLDWQSELTKTLKIWIDKGLDMTTGELILARANLGAIVESWLRFFFCVYYDDYIQKPKTNGKGRILEPDKMPFDNLKKLSIGILWDDNKSKDYLWINSIQYKRNAIHSFTYRDIGTPADFLDDIDRLYKFVDMILNRLPAIEEVIE